MNSLKKYWGTFGAALLSLIEATIYLTAILGFCTALYIPYFTFSDQATEKHSSQHKSRTPAKIRHHRKILNHQTRALKTLEIPREIN